MYSISYHPPFPLLLNCFFRTMYCERLSERVREGTLEIFLHKNGDFGPSGKTLSWDETYLSCERGGWDLSWDAGAVIIEKIVFSGGNTRQKVDVFVDRRYRMINPHRSSEDNPEWSSGSDNPNLPPVTWVPSLSDRVLEILGRGA